jgi:hypothetical protein
MTQIGGFPVRQLDWAGGLAERLGKGLTATTTGAEGGAQDAVGADVLVSMVGPVGIEPTTRGLKAPPRRSSD